MLRRTSSSPERNRPNRGKRGFRLPMAIESGDRCLEQYRWRKFVGLRARKVVRYHAVPPAADRRLLQPRPCRLYKRGGGNCPRRPFGRDGKCRPESLLWRACNIDRYGPDRRKRQFRLSMAILRRVKLGQPDRVRCGNAFVQYRGT